MGWPVTSTPHRQNSLLLYSYNVGSALLVAQTCDNDIPVIKVLFENVEEDTHLVVVMGT
jgi:hypothetical protein